MQDAQRELNLIREAQDLLKNKVMSPSWNLVLADDETKDALVRIEAILETLKHIENKDKYLDKDGFPFVGYDGGEDE